MKRIGIIGGMSYESTLHYYEGINRRINETLGGLSSADLVLRSVDFSFYSKLMEDGAWNTIASDLALEMENLRTNCFCDYIAIATNTMHKVVPDIWTCLENSWSVRHSPGLRPIKERYKTVFVHIGDCIAEECQKIGAERILLLGTKFTMTESFMRDYLLENFSIEVMDTGAYPEEIEEINRIIFEELCRGLVTAESKELMMNFANQFPCDSDERPDAIVLGCTELNMILEPDDVGVPLIDSTEAHIKKLVQLALD